MEGVQAYFLASTVLRHVLQQNSEDGEVFLRPFHAVKGVPLNTANITLYNVV